jgi:hypothetical protein
MCASWRGSGHIVRCGHKAEVHRLSWMLLPIFAFLDFRKAGPFIEALDCAHAVRNRCPTRTLAALPMPRYRVLAFARFLVIPGSMLLRRSGPPESKSGLELRRLPNDLD